MIAIEAVFYVFQQVIIIMIDVLLFAMFVRAVLSWFDPMQEWGITTFLHVLTEPAILPIRMLCEKMHWFEGMPLDIPFLLTTLVLVLIQFTLQII